MSVFMGPRRVCLEFLYISVYMLNVLWRWDDTGFKSIDVSCQKYHDTAIHHCLKVLEALAYNDNILLVN